jgi:hypothetical protein
MTPEILILSALFADVAKGHDPRRGVETGAQGRSKGCYRAASYPGFGRSLAGNRTKSAHLT